MLALGIPILGDGLYPTLTPEGQMDYGNPLRLLAKRLNFIDPMQGQTRQFESQRSLAF
jgi:tRNA pseudouridine32 synthase/23S rRNA pseudouridine746 synthase